MKTKRTKALVLGLIAILSMTMLCSCGKKKEPEKTPAKPSNSEILCEKYGEVLDKIDEYTFGNEDNNAKGTPKYAFALVKMEKGGTPSLLVTRTPADYSVSNVRIFRYDLKTETMIAPEEVLSEGVAPVGGFRGILAVEGDGNGLTSVTWSSGTGETEVNRVTVVDGKLKLEQEWTGRIDQMPERDDQVITWFDLSEKDQLKDILSGKVKASKVLIANEDTEGSDDSKDSSTETQTSSPAANEVDLKGTIRTLTYEEVVQLQKVQDPNIKMSDDERYTLLVLDQATTVLAMNGDGQGSRKGTATMVLLDPAKVKNYEGKSVTIRVKSNELWWPSDVSLPLGEPRAKDYTVIK